MNRPPTERWEEQVRQTARALPYPPTPDVSGAVAMHLATGRTRLAARRLHPAWALMIIVAILVGLLAVPPVRAALLEFLQIGGVRIWLVEPTPTATVAPATATPRPTPTLLGSLFDLAGATTLVEAEARAGFPVHLPTYPPDLGAPDGVFLQDLGGPAVILVWLDPGQAEQARLSLHLLGPGAFVEKGNPTRIDETTVNGLRAVWTTGPYMLAFQQRIGTEWDMRRLVEGHVLVWTEGELTYRLETDLPMEEAVRIAESLPP
jgi:hypothetical protein